MATIAPLPPPTFLWVDQAGRLTVEAQRWLMRDLISRIGGESVAGVTNGDSHDHVGGDGAQIDHGNLAGLGDNDHPQYLLAASAAETIDDRVAALIVAARGLASTYSDAGGTLTLDAQDAVTSVSANTAMSDTIDTYVVTASGKTMTLPQAQASRIGYSWTVVLAVNGYVDIACDTGDTFILDGNPTVLRLDNKGATVTLRCYSASSWVLA